MPSRKQRRRRAKARRHEWEEVWVDEEGNEIEPPPEDDQGSSRNAKRTSAPSRQQSGRRNVQPPSWRRVGKRGLIFAPLMFLTVSFLSGDLSIAQRIANTVFLLAFFLPFSYAMDAFMYRMFVKRGGTPAGRKS
jgi:hypothetical protein